MGNFKQKFIDTAYSKFGIKANGSINFEQAFAIIDEIEQCNIANVVGRSEQLVCDVCGSNDVIEAPHMGRNCNRCNPL